MSLVNEAHGFYLKGRFLDALSIYRKLAGLLGEDLFRANISLCEKRLGIGRNLPGNGQNRINIAFITDDGFALPTYVALHSLIRNKNDDVEVNVYVLSVNLSRENIDNLKSLQKDKVWVFILELDENSSQFSILKNGFHVSTAAITKFSLPEILADLDKVLYLDGDIIVRSDLSELYNVCIDDLYAGVVPDIKPTLKYKPSILSKLNVEHHRYYFNSGMMLLNLKKMRQDDLTNKLLDYRKNGINFFMDQDALNVVFADNVKYLSCRNNLLVTLQGEFTLDQIAHEYKEPIKCKSFSDLVESANVVHFASKEKPWKILQGEQFLLWYRYYLTSGAAANNLFEIPEVIRNVDPYGVIVSLTSYPARIGSAHITVKSLLSQTFQPSAVVLWLAEEEFPGGEVSLPKELLDLKPSGLSIQWCHNIKSYKKLIPALKAYPDNVIVTADDDIVYKPTWLEQLVGSYLQYPDSIHCCRAHKISVDGETFMSYRKWRRNIKDPAPSYQTFFTGCGGVLYPPASLHSDVMNEVDFTTLCGSGDDIWFWSMAVLNGTKIRVIPDKSFTLEFTPDSQEVALWRNNDVGGENDAMLNRILSRYPDIAKLVEHGGVEELAI
ncbi:glycosyltransferase family 8 protein [Paraburkholderia tuberum]|nr:glycosyltransferase family 8 protein [Paraburkholderia tuberum]